MLNKYFYQNKAKLYQNLKNITLLKIPLTQFLGRRGQGKGPSSTNTWQNLLNILLKTSLTCMQMISEKHARSQNTALHVRKTCWVPTRSLPRSHTFWSRCGYLGFGMRLHAEVRTRQTKGVSDHARQAKVRYDAWPKCEVQVRVISATTPRK